MLLTMLKSMTFKSGRTKWRTADKGINKKCLTMTPEGQPSIWTLYKWWYNTRDMINFNYLVSISTQGIPQWIIDLLIRPPYLRRNLCRHRLSFLYHYFSIFWGLRQSCWNYIALQICLQLAKEHSLLTKLLSELSSQFNFKRVPQV